MFFYEKWAKCNMDYVVFMGSENEHRQKCDVLNRAYSIM